MAILGYDRLGRFDAGLEDSSYGTKFTATENGTCDILKGFVVYTGGYGGDWHVKAAIYEFDSGGSHTFIEETNELHDSPSLPADGWKTFTFNSTVNLVSGTEYVIFLWGDETALGVVGSIGTKTAISGAPSDLKVVADAYKPYGGAWPDPDTGYTTFGAGTATSVYIEYTATSGITPTRTLMGVGL